jgi:hypothetical protein
MSNPHDLDRAPLVFRESVIKWLGLNALIVVGSAAAVSAYYRGSHWFLWLMTGFIAFTLASAMLSLVRPPTLTLSPRWLEERRIFKTHRWRWKDIDGFQVTRPLEGLRLVAFNSTVDSDNNREALRTGFGVQANVTLGGPWDIEAGALADLLRAARARWG